MKRNEKILFTIEVIFALIFFLSVFVINIFNDYMIFMFIILSILLIYLLMGYEKDKNIYKKNIAFFICFYTISFIIILYGIGLAFGYLKSPFKSDFISIIKNIFPSILIILSSEFLRYLICKKGEKSKKIYISTIILFVLIDLALNVKYYNLERLEDVLKFGTTIFLPSVFKNWTLTFFAYRYGLVQNVLYRLLLELYPYILPVTPELGIYLESVLMMVYPVLLKREIYYRFEKEKKKDYKNKEYGKKFIFLSTVLLTALIIALNSNLFRYWMAVIGSGSMEPTIEIGDAVIVDKSYQKRLDKLNEGDVLVFRIGEKIYTHRIINISEKNGNYSINTKGDRKGNVEDNWTVTNKDVIGVVKFKIKYIGYPTVWLSRMLEGSYE